jgi:predicted dithiol-disulfide oxidoreductase (DUF899 family)
VGSSVVLRKGVKMKITRTVSREEWLAARLDLLAKEKAASRQRYINEWPWHDTYGAPDRHAHHH